MSLKTATGFSTASIAHLYRWDEIEGWRLMLEHFDLVEGFALIVVFAPDEWGLALARQTLAERLGSERLLRVRFDPTKGTDSLAESLLTLPTPGDQVKVVWVDADPAEADRLDSREDAWRAALAKLNRYRNTLQERIGCTLAIALPSRFQLAFTHSAPDIWSIRSGVFRLEPPGGSRTGIAQLPITERALFDDSSTSETGDPYETLAQAEKLRCKPGREVLLARLLQRAGKQARTRFDWLLAEKCLEEAYSLLDAIGWGDPQLHWEIAMDLASVYFDTAQYRLAEVYYKRTLEIAEQHFGPNSPKTADALNNLALVLQATNRLADAEPLMRRALAIDEQAYGDKHHRVAVHLNNLAALLSDANELEGAEHVMHRALAIDEQTFGAEHPAVARDLNNLAWLLKVTNRLGEAEPLMRRALAIDEQAYGVKHPQVATVLNNLALLLQATSRLEEAVPMMRRALAIDEQAYEGKHPVVGLRLLNLVALLYETGRLSEALPLIDRARMIYQQFQINNGRQHPHWEEFEWWYRKMRQEAGEDKKRGVAEGAEKG